MFPNNIVTSYVIRWTAGEVSVRMKVYRRFNSNEPWSLDVSCNGELVERRMNFYPTRKSADEAGLPNCITISLDSCHTLGTLVVDSTTARSP